jgi:hypothetical protein
MMKRPLRSSNTNPPTAGTASSLSECWEVASSTLACLRVELADGRILLLPYTGLQEVVFQPDPSDESLEIRWSTGILHVSGSHLRPLLAFLQKFTLETLRVLPERYSSSGGNITSLEYNSTTAAG